MIYVKLFPMTILSDGAELIVTLINSPHDKQNCSCGEKLLHRKLLLHRQFL